MNELEYSLNVLQFRLALFEKAMHKRIQTYERRIRELIEELNETRGAMETSQCWNEYLLGILIHFLWKYWLVSQSATNRATTNTMNHLPSDSLNSYKTVGTKTPTNFMSSQNFNSFSEKFVGTVMKRSNLNSTLEPEGYESLRGPDVLKSKKEKSVKEGKKILLDSKNGKGRNMFKNVYLNSMDFMKKPMMKRRSGKYTINEHSSTATRISNESLSTLPPSYFNDNYKHQGSSDGSSSNISCNSIEECIYDEISESLKDVPCRIRTDIRQKVGGDDEGKEKGTCNAIKRTPSTTYLFIIKQYILRIKWKSEAEITI